MKAEPDLSIVQSEFSVRYECQQSLQIDVIKFIQVPLQCMIFIFYTFPSMLRRLLSESFNSLLNSSGKLSFFIIFYCISTAFGH